MLLTEKMKLVIKKKLNIQIFGTKQEWVNNGLIPDEHHEYGCYIEMPTDAIRTSIANFPIPSSSSTPCNDLESTRALRNKPTNDCGDFSILSYDICIGGIVFVVVLDSGGLFNVKITNKDLAEYQLPVSS